MDLFEGLLDELNSVLSKLENFQHVLAERESDFVADVEDIRKQLITTRNKIEFRQRLGSGASDSSLSATNEVSAIWQSSLQHWKYVGKGAFSVVFSAYHNGTKLAVKILQPTKCGSVHEDNFYKEVKLMSALRHDNIVAFRYKGTIENDEVIENWHLCTGQLFLVMEYMQDNLTTYIKSRATYEKQGLPDNLAWEFAAQMARGLAYLHNMKIAHRDLKPDNILMDRRSMRLKISDFGEAYKKLDKESSRYCCARYAPPEIWEYFGKLSEDGEDPECSKDEDFTDMFIRADVYCYGNIVAFCALGTKPWNSDTTEVINEAEWDPDKAKIVLPQQRSEADPLRQLIVHSYDEEPKHRPENATVILQTYFSGDTNPYESGSVDSDFFTCGFLRDTKLFIADSLIQETDVKDRSYPKGYSEQSLTCEIEAEKQNKLPEDVQDWEHYSCYLQKIKDFAERTRKGEIKRNTSVALSHLHIPSRTDENNDSLTLKFCVNSYAHHRAMREVWRNEMSLMDKQNEVPCKRKVHPHFSTSFGLHVTVLTADKPQEVLFFQRENTGTDPKLGSIPSPGLFTCTMTKGVHKECICDIGGKKVISLLRCAALCLNEELNIKLEPDEYKAINLHTIYLKFDNHEWGMCGYLDLADKRISEKSRLTSSQIKSRYSSAMKTKHERLFSVKFDPEAVAAFIRSNLADMASSTKMVAVKVLKAFYSVSAVEMAFKASTH